MKVWLRNTTMDTWTLTGVVGIGVAAFLLSFAKLGYVAVTAGISPSLYLLFPVLVEGFSVLCSVAAWARRNSKAMIYPGIVGGVAFLYSLWANSMPETVPPMVTRGIPSLSLMLAVHMAIVIAGREKPKPPPVMPEVIIIRSPDVDANPNVKPVTERVHASQAVRRFVELAKLAKDEGASAYWMGQAESAKAAGL